MGAEPWAQLEERAKIAPMRLYLMRHARAEVGGDAIPDHGRVLTPEGRSEAAGVGSWLAGRSEPPDLVLCSSAARAVDTMTCVLESLSSKPATIVSDDLYLVSAWKLFEQVRATEPGVSSLMLLGHNPGMAELAAKLAAAGDPAALRSLERRFPPAALAELELSGQSWPDLDPDSGKLVSHFVS